MMSEAKNRLSVIAMRIKLALSVPCEIDRDMTHLPLPTGYQ